MLVFLTACNNPQASLQISQHNDENMENVAWMREKLPAETMAYMRIPTIWEIFLEAKVDVLHSVQQLQVHKELLAQIKQGIVDGFTKLLPADAKSPFKLLVKDLSTPLELAVISASDGSMIPNTLIATTIKNTSITELNTLSEALLTSLGPQMKIIQPFNQEGQAQWLAAMIPIFASYDEKTGRLALFSGLSASAKELQTLLAQDQHDAALDNIINFENSVDTAGKNIEAWFNIKSIYQQNKTMIPADMAKQITAMGLDKVNFLWAGTSSKAGKSEFLVRLDMPEVGFRKLLPRVDSDININTAGVPRSAWLFSMPTVEQMQQAVDMVLAFDPDGDEMQAKLDELINRANDFLGVSLTEIFSAYGQKTLLITDDSGSWFASKIVNKSLHNKVMEKLGTAFKTQSSSKELAGVAIQQSIFFTREFEKKVFAKNTESNPLAKIINFRQYFFYQIEDNYLLQAFTPQVLADRANTHEKINFNDWLQKQQGQNWQTSILAYSREVQDAPRDIYYFYLNALMFIANFANVEVDLFQFPTAKQLELPSKGRAGFAIDSSTTALTLKVSYEYSALENMSFLETYFSLAIVGIITAYAVPAYKDYIITAAVTDKYFSIYADKQFVEDYYLQNNKFPSNEVLLESLGQSNDYTYDADSGQISLNFKDSNQYEIQGATLELIPVIEADNSLNWYCQSTMAQRYFQNLCTQ